MDLNGVPAAAPAVKAFEPSAAQPAASKDFSSKPLDPSGSLGPPKDGGAPAARDNAAPGAPPKPTEPLAPAPPAVSHAPKPVSVEDVPEKEGPNATAGLGLGKPAAPEPTVPPPTSSVSAAAKTQAQPSEPSKADVVPTRDETSVGKSSSAIDTDALKVAPKEAPKDVVKDAHITGPGANEPSQTAPKIPTAQAETVKAPTAVAGPAPIESGERDAVKAPAVVPEPAPIGSSERDPVKPPTTVAQPVAAGSGEREAAPQAIPAEQKPEGKTEDDKKRKADALDAGGASEAGVDGQPPESADAPNKKRKPGRPPGASNGNSAASNGKRESFGEKLVKKAKKVLPSVGRTERKTRSQGPA